MQQQSPSALLENRTYRTAIIYERVRYVMTGEARRILSRKNPEQSANWHFFHDFCREQEENEIVINWFFKSMYTNNRLRFATRPEARALLHNKLSRYVESVNTDYASFNDPVRAVDKSVENILSYLRATDVHDEKKTTRFLESNPLDHFRPDWILMLKQNLITPFFLFTSSELLRYARFARGAFQKYMDIYRALNKTGDLQKFLEQEFKKFLPENLSDYNKNFADRETALVSAL